uniref:Uncharacterized protein n=1 Tax=Petromyzon marinus TaxID=7757 RepID=S4R822_PETMA
FTAYHWAALALCFPRLQPKLGQYIHMQLQRYLTKREQRLRERRRRAKELLLWKQRLDTEEEEVRNIERMAVQARRDDRGRQNGRLRAPLGATPPSSQREGLRPVSTALLLPLLPTGFPPPQSSVFLLLFPHSYLSQAIISASATRSRSYRLPSACLFVSTLHLTDPPQRCIITLNVPLRPSPSTQTSDRSLPPLASSAESECSSEVEGRIVALRDELARRKMMVERLQKEQRRRARERLRAHESSLRLQLQAYDTFICKAQGELENSKEPRPSVRPHARTHGS